MITLRYNQRESALFITTQGSTSSIFKVAFAIAGNMYYRWSSCEETCSWSRRFNAVHIGLKYTVEQIHECSPIVVVAFIT
jgi:uncharacterized metal-binding protein